jgi:hypothetical protein
MTPHGVGTQKTNTDIFTALRISNHYYSLYREKWAFSIKISLKNAKAQPARDMKGSYSVIL